MQAGRLRDRVTIEAESRVSNGQGGFRTGWAPVASRISAEIVGLMGNETLDLGAERSAATFRVRIRKRDGVSTKNRLLWETNGRQVMAIRSILPDPREPRAMLLLECEIGQGS